MQASGLTDKNRCARSQILNHTFNTIADTIKNMTASQSCLSLGKYSHITITANTAKTKVKMFGKIMRSMVLPVPASLAGFS